MRLGLSAGALPIAIRIGAALIETMERVSQPGRIQVRTTNQCHRVQTCRLKLDVLKAFYETN
jgi:hypothetical protein